MPIFASNIAMNTNRYFIENKSNIQLAFIWQFPRNCCEISSLVLGMLLSIEFPDKYIFFIQGSSEIRTEHHFWVEIDDEVFDITANQFDEIEKPIYGGQAHPVINKKFPRTNKTSISTAVATSNIIQQNDAEFYRIIEEISNINHLK